MASEARDPRFDVLDAIDAAYRDLRDRVAALEADRPIATEAPVRLQEAPEPVAEPVIELRPVEGGYVVRRGNAAVPEVYTAEEVWERLTSDEWPPESEPVAEPEGLEVVGFSNPHNGALNRVRWNDTDEALTPHATATARVAELQAEVEKARRTSQYWKDNHLAGNKEIDRLRFVDAATVAELTDTREKLEVARARVAELQAEVERLRQVSVRRRIRSSNAQARVAELQGEVERLRGELAEERAGYLTQDEDEALTPHTTATARVAELQAEVERLRGENEAIETDRRWIASALREALARVAGMEAR